MASSQKIIAALHANWWLNLIGLALSYGGSIVLVRTMPQALFAQYSAVLAIITLATLVFEAGANSGLTRYLHDAAGIQARGTFYRQMQRRRWWAAAACAGALVLAGPWYAQRTHFDALASDRGMFALIGVIVAGTLVRLLAHYGLVALFETKAALLFQQGFQVLRAVALAVVAILGGSLAALVGTLVALALVEAVAVDRRLWEMIRAEQAPLPAGFVTRAQRFGLLTVFDKACAMLGSGSVLLLVLAPQHPAATIACLGLAVDLSGKLIGLTVMPMGNLVAPFLSQTSDDAAAQGRAIARVIKLSSLLYVFSIGAGLLALPAFVPLVYGRDYAAAALFATLLIVPTAFENWVRGTCSPALLRNSRYGALVRVNILQAVATVTTLALVVPRSAELAIVAVGAVRSVVASLNLVSLRQLVPARAYQVPLLGLLLAVAAGLLAWRAGESLAAPAVARTVAAEAVFALLFYLGLRWVIFRDADTLHLAHRVAGARLKPLARLLPPQPVPQS